MLFYWQGQKECEERTRKRSEKRKRKEAEKRKRKKQAKEGATGAKQDKTDAGAKDDSSSSSSSSSAGLFGGDFGLIAALVVGFLILLVVAGVGLNFTGRSLEPMTDLLAAADMDQLTDYALTAMDLYQSLYEQ